MGLLRDHQLTVIGLWMVRLILDFFEKFDYALLGDIHKHQFLNAGQEDSVLWVNDPTELR